jgi:PPM family protein phosphatase
MTRWESASSTHVGNVREANEDAVLVTPTMAVVADGMGGHAAGEVASALAVEAFPRLATTSHDLEGLTRAVVATNQVILDDAAENPSREGMGTTLVGVVHVDRADGVALALVNIGDSRCYRVRAGQIVQLTSDHSWAEEMVRAGRLTAEEATSHPRRHQLTRVLGMADGASPDVSWLAGEPGDVFVLCSDGLSNEVTDQEIAAVVTAAPTLEEASRELVARALDHGGRDNVSVVVVRLTSVDHVNVPPPDASPPEPPKNPSAPSVRRRPRVSLVSALFTAGFLALVVIAVVFLNWYGHDGYYVGVDQAGVVQIYQGHEGGFLWVQPQVYPLGGAPLLVTSLTSYQQEQVRNALPEASLAAAIAYYSQLQLSAHVDSSALTTNP